jgi:hypothetical protein
MNAIHPLAKETVRFLNSGQVITDLSTIVKELIEYVSLFSYAQPFEFQATAKSLSTSNLNSIH